MFAAAALMAACADTTSSGPGRGAATGSAVGAILGGAIGAAVADNDLIGPLIGAGVGAVLGGAVGYGLDRQQKALDEALEPEQAAQQASVQRVADDQIRVALSDELAFDPGSADIRPDALPTIERVADALAKQDSSKVRIVGHASGAPTPDANRQLAEARAASVRDALAVYGVDRARISTEGQATPGTPANGTPGTGSADAVEILVSSMA